jgi:hypothetical protein
MCRYPIWRCSFFLVTNSIEQSPTWEAASRSPTQEFFNVLRNPMVHYRVHPSLPLVHILCQMYPVHSTPSYFSMICFNTSHLLLGLPACLFRSGFPSRTTNTLRSRVSVVDIATGYGRDDWGVEVRVTVGARIFSSPNRPDPLWGPLRLLSSVYGGKGAGAWS